MNRTCASTRSPRAPAGTVEVACKAGRRPPTWRLEVEVQAPSAQRERELRHEACRQRQEGLRSRARTLRRVCERAMQAAQAPRC
ncbi:MAG: hypothetical protein ACLF0G_11305 [Candidatus Brocadiia bacterium]